MVKQQYSAVWQHFTSVGQTSATCNYCRRVIFKTAGNLRRHLKKKHPTISVTSYTIVREPGAKSDVALRLSHIKRMGKKHSPVWRHFTTNDQNSATCNYCQTVISLSGGSPGNLKRHLDKKHPTISVIPNAIIREPLASNDDNTLRHSRIPTKFKKRSALWEHFTPDDKNSATCNYCRRAIFKTTGNLKRHLNKKHPTILVAPYTIIREPVASSDDETSIHTRFTLTAIGEDVKPFEFVTAVSPSHSETVSLSEAMKIGFIGGGRLAFALANGFISAGLAKPEEIIASCHPSDVASAEAFKKLGATAIFENRPVVERSEVVIVSVKPDVVQPALREVAALPAAKDRLFISVAMGVSISTIEKVLPESRVIRVMPNTPALVKEGAAALSRGSKATAEDAKLGVRLFKAVGTCEEVPEYQMDAITALSGSGPAYVYMMIESLADGGVRCGLPRDLALRLAAQTTLGAAAMLKCGGHPATLKDNVTSPAGSTAEGTFHLEHCGFRAAVIGAVKAATDRCKVVNQQLNN